jgi:neutral ceramidase
VTASRRARLRVRVLVSGGLGSRARGRTVRLTREVTAAFRARRARTLRLRLTAAGRARLAAALRACRRPRLSVYVRRRDRGRDARLHRSVRRVGVRGRCRSGSPPPRLPGGVTTGGAGTSGPGAGGSAAPGGGRTTPDPPAGLLAGAADADITPPVGTPMFAYTARSNLLNPPAALQVIADPDTNLYAKSFAPSEGIHTRVRARALVLQAPGGKLALVQADLGGLPYALTQAVQARIADLGIPPDRVVISATHTHASTGPLWPADSTGYALLGGDAFDPRIFGLTADGIAEAIRTAHDRLEPARAGVGTAPARDASRNRSLEAFARNADVPADEAERRAASVDPTVTVLRVDARDGRPLAVWSNFAIHPTSFGADNLLFSGDNAGAAVREAEAAIARLTPGRAAPVNVWTNGTQGDISPDGEPDRPEGGTGPEDDLEWAPTAAAQAHLAGRRVADGIVAAWRDAGDGLRDAPPLEARRTLLRFDGTPADGEPVGANIVLGAGGITAGDGTCAPADGTAGPGQGRKFPTATGELVPRTVPVSLVRVGGLGIAALPSEVTRQQGVRLRRAVLDAAGGTLDRLALAGMSNAYVSYTATEEEYDACRYEGSFTLFGRRQGARLRDVARTLAEALRAGAAAPAGAPEPPPLGAGAGEPPLPRSTPDAGQVVAQPAPQATRHGRVTFSWRGGDPAIDAPRGRSFVTVERQTAGGWEPVTSDDGLLDTTAYDRESGVWTETLQLGTCDALVSHRFRVTGRADRGDGVAPYEIVSDPFDVTPLTGLAPGAVGVTDGVARVEARYPDPGPALVALPRRVRDGVVTLRVTEAGSPARDVEARPDADALAFTAPVPEGAAITVAGVADGCGNTG